MYTEKVMLPDTNSSWKDPELAIEREEEDAAGIAMVREPEPSSFAEQELNRQQSKPEKTKAVKTNSCKIALKNKGFAASLTFKPL
ncbi:MAG: hypothetical protein IJJ66_06815 [Treponema sp.]|nr:hypothetical protein [Treponema sp.]MBR0476508.1 hypothetical protein [Treponema sp.]